MKKTNLKFNAFKKASLSVVSMIVFFVLAGTILSGCESNSVVTPTTDNVSVSAKLSDAAVNNPLAAIQITSAKALITELEIESSDSSSSHEIKITPFVINFDLAGNLNQIISAYIPAKTYKKIKFKIHKPEDTEYIPDPEFRDGPSGNQRYSFIIKGTYNGTPFVYKSRKSANIILNMNQTITFGSNKINITMLINKLSWFLKNGNELDPSDDNNSNDIDDNLKTSFKNAFKDDDFNGVPDSN